MRSISLRAAVAACALLGTCTIADARDSEFHEAATHVSRTARASLVTNQRAVTTATRGSFAGRASYYAHPGRTASGSRFNPHGLTAAHRSLPFGTKLRVSDPGSGRSVVVTVNDRGPFTGGRVLGMTQRGVMQVRAERI
jgi:rare lipoprotein A